MNRLIYYIVMCCIEMWKLTAIYYMGLPSTYIIIKYSRLIYTYIHLGYVYLQKNKLSNDYRYLYDVPV